MLYQVYLGIATSNKRGQPVVSFPSTLIEGEFAIPLFRLLPLFAFTGVLLLTDQNDRRERDV